LSDSPPATRRQQLADLLVQGPWGFDELRRELELTVQDLADDLRHLERSARRGAARLRVEPARCTGCGFVFRDRAARHLHPPSRCPRCKGERIVGPRFSLG
jgi:predicted Zn-ribbon and HTH transcriptional regulator